MRTVAGCRSRDRLGMGGHLRLGESQRGVALHVSLIGDGGGGVFIRHP